MATTDSSIRFTLFPGAGFQTQEFSILTICTHAWLLTKAPEQNVHFAENCTNANTIVVDFYVLTRGARTESDIYFRIE